jgi:hypothetical protein
MMSGSIHFLVWQEVVADHNLRRSCCCMKGLTDGRNTQAGLPNEITTSGLRETYESIQLHIFADASKVAFAAVAYIRILY